MIRTATYDDNLYQLVPKETSLAMDDAAEQYYVATRNKCKGQWWWNRLYQAYLSAAPTPPAQPVKPLTDEQVGRMYRTTQLGDGYIVLRSDYERGIRDAEAAHGIKE